MKSLNQYITEKLKVSKKQNQYNYCPQTREELDDLLDQLLKERGWEADLNDIDVSNITDMSGLFAKFRDLIDNFKYNTDYDFSSWENATEYAIGGEGAYGKLYPRGIPFLKDYGLKDYEIPTLSNLLKKAYNENIYKTAVQEAEKEIEKAFLSTGKTNLRV